MKVNSTLLKKAEKNLKTLNHPLRLKILSQIEKKEKSVTGIYKALSIEQSVCSQHIGWLREAGLIIRRREGKEIFYKADLERVKYLEEIAAKLA